MTAVLVGIAKTGISGMAILVVPLIALVFPAKESVGALLPMLIAGDIMAVMYYRQHAQWRQLVRLVPGVAAGMLIGGLYLARLDNQSMRNFLGVFVLLLLAIELITRRLNLTQFTRLRSFAMLIGVMAGFGTTVGNSAGPIMGIYLIMMGLDKKQLMGTGAWFFLIVNTSKLPIFFYHEMINAGTLKFFVVMLPFIICGTFLGRKLLRVLSQSIFDFLVLLFAGLSSLWLLLF
ncbi:MAG: sulfite exporter TauE/SafE family protein [Desulfobacterales bacterium]|nr:sulfite exporter TauE/SafE family protein [Desulfobacterales bacterium]